MWCLPWLTSHMTNNTSTEMSRIMYSATVAGTVYTITREIAGGAFTPRADGEVIGTAGRLSDARGAVRAHSGGRSIQWTDEAQQRALGNR